ncbi:hypothetical protein BJV82DRAFT_654022 [Fennellomyces sp. T-0311]|nr:hypothetical protein BJV82DRAFT_654022 [Fennellomyces sp. T-0311]
MAIGVDVNIICKSQPYKLNNFVVPACKVRCPFVITLSQEPPEFRPTWLVRVSDMQVVPGSTMCIDQDDHDAKMREIRQMHHIYENARCALALVPELGSTAERDEYGQYLANIDVIPDSQWAKRMWTLEEAYMSKKILFVGRDVHFWTNYSSIKDDGPAGTFIASIQHTKKWKACTALWHAKRRTSSTAHDRIFALANIFPELKDRITFSYHQSELDLAIQFYGRLAEHDISILLFGAPAIDDTRTASSGAECRLEDMPSWTGANGIHIPQRCGEAEYEPDSRAFDCIVTGNGFLGQNVEFCWQLGLYTR